MKNVLAGLFFVATSAAIGQQKWSTDPAHSSVKFSVPHLMVSEVDGRFTKFNGSINTVKSDFTQARIAFTVDVNSVNTDNEKRDKHLLSEDFFDAEKFPSMSFTSTSFVKVKANKYLLEGNLTIKNVTKKVRFDVTYLGKAQTKQGAIAGFKATAIIDRFAYGLKWNALTEAGGAMVGNEITIVLNLEFNETK